MKTQIYAHKTVEEAKTSARLGVDFIGVSAGERGRLPQEVNFENCRGIFATVRATSAASVVALTVAWEAEEILEIVKATQPDIIHLSGEFNLYDVAIVADLRQVLSPTKVMMAIPVGFPNSVEQALPFVRAADLLILDTDHANIKGVGATGEVHDWNLSAEIVRRAAIPIILAGGLSAQNVQEAIRKVHPWAVDSYTHTNMAGECHKDPKKVEAFVKAARAWT